jgi:hypothetical protein
LFKRELRSPRRIGKNLKGKLRKVEPHSRGSRILSRGGSDRISKDIMLTPTLFLVPGVEEEVVGESSHALHVGKTDIKPLIVQRGSWTEETLMLLRHRGVMPKVRMLEVESH